jgi:hypothetical protein
MYRGSNFLLQKDYKIHTYAIKALLQDKYDSLWQVTPQSFAQDKSMPDLIIDVRQEVTKAYMENIYEVNGKKKVVNVSDTLASKILLGTMGCIPAYDRYFIAGLRTLNFNNLSLSANSVREIMEFYSANAEEFCAVQENIETKGFHYPMMKLLDMYFWQVGFNAAGNVGKDLVPDENRTIKKIKTHKMVVRKENSEVPSIIKMVIELVNGWEGDSITFNEILQNIKARYGDVNAETLKRQVYACTVNQPARVNWYPNKRERIANSEYDLLYTIGPSQFEKYDPQKHGVWEIRKISERLQVSRR